MKKKVLFAAAFMLATVGAYAQGNGIAGITEATNMVTSYFDPGTKLIYAVGAVVGLIGGVKVYSKFSSGDPDTSKTAANMVNNFQETVKIYEQGKKYYDALKSVNNLVKDARKVQQTILMVGDITDIYVTSFQKMLRDDNFTVEELGAIAFGYTKLLEESNDVLTELKNVVNITTLSMTDKERMDVVERCHSKMKRYRNLVSYYTNKNISVSYLRAKKKNDLDRIMGLYGSMNERYW